MTRLSRSTHPSGPPSPVRIVHLGVGAFHRAHQSWYTERAGDGWGIAAVAPRSDDAVHRLVPQDGLYTVLTRGPEGDQVEVVSTLAEVLAGRDDRWRDLVAGPEVAVVSLTVTEAGYTAGSPVLAGLVDALDRRRRAGGGPLALVSCDNLAGNGRVLGDLVTAAAGDAAADLLAHCTFPSTVVDRITPATRTADLDAVASLLGLEDQAAVVTEPVSEWVLEDAFPAGRPAWERAGARFVDDVGPWSSRKLLLLNAGHSLLAELGVLRGHTFVHEAAGDPVVHLELGALWAEARPSLPPSGDLGRYCATIEDRWANHRLPHALVQIGTDASLKLAQRIVPTVVARRAAGMGSPACARVLGAWVARVRADPGAVSDARADQIRAAVAGTLPDAARRLIGLVDPGLVDDADLGAYVAAAAGDFGRRSWRQAGGSSR